MILANYSRVRNSLQKQKLNRGYSRTQSEEHHRCKGKAKAKAKEKESKKAEKEKAKAIDPRGSGRYSTKNKMRALW